MKKYTLEVLMNSSNTSMSCSEQTKEYTILAEYLHINDGIYKFSVKNQLVGCYPVRNTLITEIVQLT